MSAPTKRKRPRDRRTTAERYRQEPWKNPVVARVDAAFVAELREYLGLRPYTDVRVAGGKPRR